MVEWTGIILAGGIGSRLMPITADRPKPLVPVVGKPMIVYAIDLLLYAGVHNIVIVIKHMGDQIREFLAHQDFGVDIKIPEVDSLGTADAVRKVSDYVKTDHLVVSMADIITNIHLREFLDFKLERGGIGAMSLVDTDNPNQFGVIVLDQEHKIHSFLEKPGSVELYLSSMISTQNVHLHKNVINTGIYAFQREVLDILHRTNLMDFGKDVFPYFLENEYILHGYIAKYYWQDAGNPEFYKYTNWDLLRKWAWPIVPSGKEVREYIWIGDNCDIPNLNDINQHVAIGNNTRLGTNVHIETLTALGKQVEVGQNTQIRECVIWDNVHIGKDCRIISSIICENVEIGDDVLIEPNVVIASNSKVKSGTKITSGKQFSPHSEIGF
ncbi:MAG: NDP-sugar synthase [Candidatus Helarchaeota archaeon]|nr:NDP-sugar synthase [Candidatus Helarchaeota archaeon]